MTVGTLVLLVTVVEVVMVMAAATPERTMLRDSEAAMRESEG